MVPKYSVVIPTMNRADQLSRAINSVLRQSLDGDLEIVVVDNCSDDHTQQLLTSLPYKEVRVIRQPRRVSRIENFTTALTAARGEYVSILYDDEEMLADNLIQKGRVLDQYPDVIAATSSVTKRDHEGNLSPGTLMRSGFVIEDRFDYLRNTFQQTTGGLPPFLMRRSAAQSIRLDPRDEPLDDNAFILRLSTLGRIATLPEGLVTDTVTEGEMVRNGLLEPMKLPNSDAFVMLPGIWFYWSQFRFRVEHVMNSPDLSHRQIQLLYRLAWRVFRQGIWKAAYHRLMVAKQLGPALALLAKAATFNRRLLIPPVWFFLRWKLNSNPAPIPAIERTRICQSYSRR